MWRVRQVARRTRVTAFGRTLFSMRHLSCDWVAKVGGLLDTIGKRKALEEPEVAQIPISF